MERFMATDKPNRSGLFSVDRPNDSWFAEGVQMSVSAQKSDSHRRGSDGKNLNPDAHDGGTKASARTAKRDEPTDEQLLADYRGGEKSKFALLVMRYQR